MSKNLFDMCKKKKDKKQRQQQTRTNNNGVQTILKHIFLILSKIKKMRDRTNFSGLV